MRTLRLLLPLVLALIVVLLMRVSLARATASAETPPSIPWGAPSASRASDPARPTLTTTPASTSLITAQVPILTYHTVSTGSRGIGVAAPSFAAQMDWLQKNGYTSVSIDQIAAALRGQTTLPPRPVALTFDDGWAQVYTNVVPVLQAHGFRGTFFIIAGYSTGRLPIYLSWDQIKALHDAGMWIGAHSFSHPNLNRLNAIGLRHEIVDAKSEIEKHIGGSVTVLAYPYGAYSLRVMQAVQAAGYAAAVTVGPRLQQQSDQIYRLNRITISSAMTMAQFESYLTGKKIAPRLPSPSPPRPDRGLDTAHRHSAS